MKFQLPTERLAQIERFASPSQGSRGSGLQITGNADELYEDQYQIPDTQIIVYPGSGPAHPETH